MQFRCTIFLCRKPSPASCCWFFFEKDGRYGISYGGEELPLTWEHIPHLGCCGGWYNPTGPWLWGGRDTITFYGWEDGAYSLVEVRK